MKKSKTTERKSGAEVLARRIVRLLWSAAPRIGTPGRIWCGVTKHEDGRDVHCTIGSRDDRYRKCKIIGYQVEMGDKGNPDTEGHEGEGVTLLVKVRMNQSHPLIERVHLSHIDCLEAYAKKPNSKLTNPAAADAGGAQKELSHWWK